MRNEFVIKNAVIKFGDLWILAGIIFIVYANIVTGFLVPYLIFTSIALIPLLWCFYKMVQRILNRENKIIINQFGIQIAGNKNTIEWDIIEDIYFYTQHSGNSTLHFLRIITKNDVKNEHITMLDYKYREKSVIQAINRFSGRNFEVRKTQKSK